MKSPAIVLVIPALSAMLLPVFGFASETRQLPLADVIVTSAPVYLPLAPFGIVHKPAGQPRTQTAERFPKGAQLELIHAGKAEPLVKSFAATADAQVSFDGKCVLFAGKENATAPWQIWELTLSDRSVRKVVSAPSDLVRPFYLPYGRLVYARRGAQGFFLETAALPDYKGTGSNIPVSQVVRVTFLPVSTLPAGVLADGRILFEAAYPLGTGTSPELYLVYSDGSGVESYRCDHGAARWGGTQFSSGDVVFTHGSSLARFTSPLAHEERVNAPHAEYAGSPAETAEGEWLVSARTAPGAHFALTLWKPGTPALQTVLASASADLVEPVVVAEHVRPKQHPTALHPWSYANLLALDARESREGNLKTTPKSVRLETLDAAGHIVITGTAPVEPDGSFFVQVPGDKPIRFSLLDEKGSVVRQEHGWFWIRAGEQRYCVGCHAGPERASENTVPAVLLRSTIPVDLTGAAKPQGQKTPGGK
jgi:hypothetical protein